MAAAGHTVDYLFHEHLPAPGPASLRRFTVPLVLPGLVRRLARNGRGYDIVEVHEPLAAPYCLARKRDRRLPPVALFSYGLEERGRKAELAYRQKKGLPVSIKKRYSPMTVVLQAMLGVRRGDLVICSNAEDVRYLRQAGVPAERLTQHHSGVDPEFLQAGETLARQAPSERKGILFLSSWLLRKGILDLVPAVSAVLRAHQAMPCTVAGCGYEAENVLQDFPEDVRARVEVIPHIATTEPLIGLYGRHSILALPSYFEGQPLVMIEAAAMGLAIVTTPICGMADFIVPGENGLTAPVGDSDALAAQLRALVEDEALARRLGEAARRTAQEYTWARATDRLLAAYARVLGEAPQEDTSLPAASTLSAPGEPVKNAR